MMQLSAKTVENQLAIAMRKLTLAVSFRLEMEMARRTH
jgi:RNA polymerase sigma-70 factor (ECF subfamily)